jgi:hypothetical protein
MNLTTHLHLLPRSKNEWSYTSTPQYTGTTLPSSGTGRFIFNNTRKKREIIRNRSRKFNPSFIPINLQMCTYALRYAVKLMNHQSESKFFFKTSKKISVGFLPYSEGRRAGWRKIYLKFSGHKKKLRPSCRHLSVRNGGVNITWVMEIWQLTINFLHTLRGKKEAKVQNFH